MSTEALAARHAVLMDELREVRSQLLAAGSPAATEEPWVALYVEPLRALLGNGDRAALTVLMALVCHTDEVGQCWPGLRYLGEVTRYAPQTVWAAIERLWASDLVRVEQVRVRRRTLTTFHVNPALCRVRPALVAEVQATWHAAPKCFVTEYDQPDTSPDTSAVPAPAPTPVPQPVTTNQPGASRVGRSQQRVALTAPRRASALRSPRASAPNGAHLDAPRPPAPSVARKDTPPVAEHPPVLSDGDAALVEQARVLLTNLSRRNAEDLVRCYGPALVRAALRAANQRKDLRNPAGWVRSGLAAGDFTTRADDEYALVSAQQAARLQQDRDAFLASFMTEQTAQYEDDHAQAED